MAVVTFLEAIRQALWEEMETDQRVFLLGQDIGTYGGAFRVTAGFLERFGRERIIDTPISESAMVGAAIGAAMMGMRPVVEMQFIDFIACAFNQIVNFAAPNHYRWGQRVPLVVRGPSGGNVHGSAFHSQNPECYFQHAPGLKDRGAGHRVRRQGPAQGRHPRPQPGALLRAQVPLPPDQGGAAGGRLDGADRQGAPGARGARPVGPHLRCYASRGAGGRRAPAKPTGSTSKSSTCARSSPSTRRPSSPR